ncbi:hypothetical protein ABK040_001616 [Willaertia magna]
MKEKASNKKKKETPTKKKPLSLIVSKNKEENDNSIDKNTMDVEEIKEDEFQGVISSEVVLDSDTKETKSEPIVIEDSDDTKKKTTKTLLTLKSRDDTNSAKKRKRKSVKEEDVDQKKKKPEDETNYVSKNDKNSDEFLLKVSEVFLTKEQKQRKREILARKEFEKNQEKRKEINSIFCKGTGEHPLMKINREKKNNTKKTSKSPNVENLEDWEGITPLKCTITADSLQDFGVCYHLRQGNLMKENIDINASSLLDDILGNDMSDGEEYTFICNTEITSSCLKKLISNNSSKERKTITNNKTIDIEDTIDISQLLSDDTVKEAIDEAIDLIYPSNFQEKSKQLFYQMYSSCLKKRYGKCLEEDSSQSQNSQSNSLFSTSQDNNEHSLWFTKYSPSTYRHVLCDNPTANIELHNWLKHWKAPTTKDKRKSKANKKKKEKNAVLKMFYREGDPYEYNFSSEDEDDLEELDTCVLLHGKTSSGKTASVTANAEELGLSIFEINATNDRSFSSITDVVHETTQSRSISFGKSDSKDNNSSNLIVFEDASLKFGEHDKGFVKAIKQISEKTKRPIVIVCDEFDKENNEFASFVNYIICFDQLNPFLSTEEAQNPYYKTLLDKLMYTYIICLAEGYNIDIRKELLPLIMHYVGDLKKILSSLQYWFNEDGRMPYNSKQKNQQTTGRLLENIYSMDENSLLNVHKDISHDLLVCTEDTFEHRSQFHILFHNYLNNSKNVNVDFITNLSEFDNLLRKDDILSCNISSDLEILLTTHCLPNHQLEKVKTKEESNIVEIFDKPYMILSSGLKASNNIFNYKVELRKQFFEKIFKMILEQTEFTTLHLSNYLDHRKDRIYETIHHLTSICSSEKTKKQSGRSKRRFHHYLTDIFNEEDIALLTSLSEEL